MHIVSWHAVGAAGGSQKYPSSHSGFVSPESSVGGHSDHHYPSYPPAAAVPLVNNQNVPTTAHSQPAQHAQQQHPPALAVPTPRAQLPDLDPSQPGPIEIDTSLLYTPQSGNSSADVSQSGAQLDAEHSVNSRESQRHYGTYLEDVNEVESVKVPYNAEASSSGRPEQAHNQQRALSAPRTRAGPRQSASR